ncbi:MAG: hypothetical protein JWO58_964 [Chitinophagaceae bacterium]|nr:hypothetical protein [Chitinophagaceae bacterium]
MLKKIKWNWKKITLLSIVVVLIIARLMLPYFVTNYVNKVLADLKGYTGKIEDVDIAFYRGAYVIKELQLDKTGNKVPVPFVKCNAIDLSIEWRALLHLKVKAKVKLEQLVLNFVTGPTKETSQSGKEADWTKALDKLLPIQVNRFEIKKGLITYKDFHTDPKVDIYLKELELIATNLSNIVDKQKILPSSLYLSSTSIGGGKLLVTGGLNVLKETPDADLNIKFTDVDLTAMNQFTKAYAKFDFERGKLSVFSQLAMIDGKVDGYVKPLLTDLKVLSWTKEQDPPLNELWQATVGLVIDIVKNHPKDQFATKVEIHGDIKNTKVNVWDAIINVLRNGFIEAFKKNFDESTNLESVLPQHEEPNDINKEQSRKDKREKRRQERKEKNDTKKQAQNKYKEDHNG